MGSAFPQFTKVGTRATRGALTGRLAAMAGVVIRGVAGGVVAPGVGLKERRDKG